MPKIWISPHLRYWIKSGNIVQSLHRSAVWIMTCWWQVLCGVSLFLGVALTIAGSDQFEWSRGDPFKTAILALLFSVGIFFTILSILAAAGMAFAVIYLMSGAARTSWRQGKRWEAVLILSLIPVAVIIALNWPNDSR